MKRQVCALLCAALLAMGAGALAQTATYVFPYEGFRYTQREDETVLTQTNLSEHEELLVATHNGPSSRRRTVGSRFHAASRGRSG